MRHIAMPRLDLRDLQVALAIAEAGSTAQAAELLHLSQPAVSRALLQAESKLGTALFERTAHGLVPTLAGERILAAAPGVLAELVDVEHRARTPAGKPRRLRLVCECYTAYHWLPSALVSLRQKLPGLELSLAIEHTADPVAALSTGDIDAALLTSASVPRGPLREEPLFSDEVVFVVAATHPLAARKVLTAADLKAHTILTSNTPVSEAHWFMRRVFGKSRPVLRLERLPLTEAVMDVARAGMGIAVLSAWIASQYLQSGELVAKRLATGPLLRPWRLAYRSELRELAPRLVSALSATLPRPRLTASLERGAV